VNFGVTRIAPAPVRGLSHASAAVESAYGRVSVAWRLDDAGDLEVEVELPAGTTGELALPVTDASAVTLDGSAMVADAPLGPGRHQLTVHAPRIVEQATGS